MADLNIGEPRTVRLIYFLPQDRAPQENIDARLDTLIRSVQSSFAEQMENHGFGGKTFRFETDGDGRAVVHHVKGKYDVDHYLGQPWIRDEIWEQFDLLKNVYLAVLDAGDIAPVVGNCGLGQWLGLEGGLGLIYPIRCFKTDIAAHELAHAFGLHHDRFRYASRSPFSYYGHTVNTSMLTSSCAAKWLDAHAYFNSGRSHPEDDAWTTIKMLPPLAVPPHAVRLRFEITDPDGLHQGMLLMWDPDWNVPEAIDCQSIDGESATVEFVTSEVTEAPGNAVVLWAVDVHGNITEGRYEVDIAALLEPEIVTIPDANLAAEVEEALGVAPGESVSQLDMLRLRRLRVDGSRIAHIGGLEHAVNLTHLHLLRSQIIDTMPLAELIALRELTFTRNSISDLSPLAALANLRDLELGQNSVSDLSPLAGLTNLGWLGLGQNSVSDLSSLAGLTNLWSLELGQNSVSDLSPLAGLTRLQFLGVDGNPVSDLSPLTRLNNLESLSLSGTSVTDLSPLVENRGLGHGDAILVSNVDLNYPSIRTHIPILQNRGVTVEYRDRTPTSINITGEGQVGTPGSVLAEPLSVHVRDERGVAFEGVPVSFAVTDGEGMLSTLRDTTDADGRAATSLSLGVEPGAYRVEATVAGLEPIIFTATAEATTDFDGDGVTGFTDFFLFAEAFGGTDRRFDLDGSGKVDFTDFFLFAEAFGQPARTKLVAMAREMIGLPKGPQLRQNAPNPFNSGTVITWFQLQPGPARVEVFALTGQRVAVLHEGARKAGLHRLRWDGLSDQGRRLGSGVYLYRLLTAEVVQTRKLTLMR